jgi:glycosyltransferase involved in cell wall biosynthesis
MRGWASKLNITHSSNSSSSGGSRSLLGSTAQQLQQEEEQLDSEQQGGVHDDAALAAHVGDVVQQIKDFAGQLPARQQQPQQSINPSASSDAAAAAQRRLQAGLPDRLAGISRLEPQLEQYQNPPAITRTGPAPPAANATSAQAAAVAAIKEAFAAEAAAAAHPTLYVVDSHISDADFPRFYKAGDAFVLPSRGEGWGRPHVEAMSMGLPVISTNWSGITAYLDDSCGYPIAVDGLVPVSGDGDEVIWWFRGLKWAQPSVTHLAQLMRRVYENRAEAAAKGAAGRARMVERYSPAAIADVVVRELQRIQDRVP